MRALVFQHISCEHPGHFADFADERGLVLDIVEVDAEAPGRPIPDPLDYDALLVFGGPMNVDEDERYPWLPLERAAIRRGADGGVPFLGICLGGQLLARALGADVRQNPVPEVGFQAVDLELAGQDDPLFRALGDRVPVFQWHGDTFAIPDEGIRLARSRDCPNQAFRYGPHAYGLQFHVEVTRQQVAEWGGIPEYRAALQRLYGPDGPERLLAEADQALPALRQVAYTMFDNFYALIQARAAARRR